MDFCFKKKIDKIHFSETLYLCANKRIRKQHIEMALDKGKSSSAIYLDAAWSMIETRKIILTSYLNEAFGIFARVYIHVCFQHNDRHEDSKINLELVCHLRQNM